MIKVHVSETDKVSHWVPNSHLRTSKQGRQRLGKLQGNLCQLEAILIVSNQIQLQVRTGLKYSLHEI